MPTNTHTTHHPLRHLIANAALTRATVDELLKQAHYFLAHPNPPPLLLHKIIGLLFFEASTRTYNSFLLAAQKLQATILPLNLAMSALTKGEEIGDMLDSLSAMGAEAFVIRHASDTLHEALTHTLARPVSIINAGAGITAHPTQALADLLTIQRHFSTQSLRDLNVTIVGDVGHSRVAQSLMHLLTLYGVNQIRLVGPASWVPAQVQPPISTHLDLATALQGTHVIYMLRIQRERMGKEECPDLDHYHQIYGLRNNLLSLAQPNAIIMHPGPINRGIEISDDLVNHSQSKILQQISHGVVIRMAVLTWVFGKEHELADLL